MQGLWNARTSRLSWKYFTKFRFIVHQCKLKTYMHFSGNQRQSLNSINGTDNSYGACFFSGYVFHGQPLKVFPNHVGKLVNHKRNVRTIQECIEECRRKRLCGWFNWMDNTNTDMNLRNTCWLKKGRGNPNPTWKTRAFTGNRNASWQCTPWLWTYNKANGHDLFWYPVIM